MVKQASDAMEDMDCAVLVVEPKPPKKMELDLIDRFRSQNIPIILVINKVDINKKDNVAKTIAEYAQICDFASIVPLSALKKDNVQALMDELLKIAGEEGPAYYPDDIATDQSERQMVAEIIREKLLRSLSEEVPHGTAVEIQTFTEREDKPIIEITADIICEKASHKGIIIGKNGQMLKNIASQAREDMERLLQKKVFLQCFVKVREDWRNNEKLIEEYEQ